MLKRAFGHVKETWLYKRKWRFIIGGPLLAYGLNWKWEDFCADRYLQKMVNQALLEGDQPVIDSPIKHVHIILNPVAGGGYARQTYERFAKPVFDCAGYQITVHKTEYVKHEKDIAAEIPAGDVIVIAGGDTTVTNVLTALNRRADFDQFKNVPVGIIPLGATNHVWHQFSGQKCGTWKNPYTRGMRVVEAAEMIVNAHTKKADVLALTNDNDKTIFTLSGFRWGKYYDMEERFADYWYWPTKALKRRIAYLMAYARNELGEMRSAHIQYANCLTQDEMEQRQYEQEEQNRLRKKLTRRKMNLFGGRQVAQPEANSEAKPEMAQVSLSDLKAAIRREFFEVEVKVNHAAAQPEVRMNFENAFAPSNLWKMLIPFTNDALSTRRLDFGATRPVDADGQSVADFTFQPLEGVEKFEGDEERKDYSYYIDGEAFVPCKLKAKLLVEHMPIFVNKS